MKVLHLTFYCCDCIMYINGDNIITYTPIFLPYRSGVLKHCLCSCYQDKGKVKKQNMRLYLKASGEGRNPTIAQSRTKTNNVLQFPPLQRGVVTVGDPQKMGDCMSKEAHAQHEIGGRGGNISVGKVCSKYKA